MKLFTFIAFLLLMEAQSHNVLQKPKISVSEDLDISCEIPLSVRAEFICRLYSDGDLLDQSVYQWSSSVESQLCMFYPNLADLLRGSGIRQLSCDYSLKTEPEIKSPRSDTRTIRGLPRARLTASASVIKETDTVELSCENTEDLKMEMEMCVFNINGRESNSKQSSSELSLTGDQIRVWSEDQSSSVTITCFYTVMKRQDSVQSPHSDPVRVTVLNIVQTSTAYPKVHPDKETWFTALVSTAVGLLVLSGLICLCWFARAKKIQKNKMTSVNPNVSSQGIDVSCSGSEVAYSLVTFVPATSQPTSDDDLANKKQNQANTKKYEQPKPVQSNTGDPVYSLVKTH